MMAHVRDAEEASTPRRAGAVASLLLLALTLVAAAVFIARHLLLVVAVDLLVVAAVAGVWEAAVGRGARRVVALAVAVGALVAVVVAFVWTGSLLGLALVVGLGTLAAVVARTTLAREIRPRVERHRPAPAGQPVFFMNPRSGGGKVEAFDLVARAEALGARVELLVGDADVVAMAIKAVRDGADVLGAAGGDGTQALVAKVAADHGVAFVCVPAGTRNHFALDLGLDRDDPAAALDALGDDAVEALADLAEVSGRPFVNNVSMGVYAKVVQSDAYRDDKVGTFADMLPDLVGPDSEPFDLRCLTPAGPVEGPELLMVSNNPYRFTTLADFGTRDRIDTGHLGVLVAQVDSASAAAQLVRLSAIGAVERYEGWQTFTATELEVTSESGRIEAGIDGEAVVLDSPAEFTIRPGVLRVRLPRERPGVQVRPPLLRSTTLARLWRLAVSGR